ncbi:hypothetical protein PFISCL1PPCAC_11322, partial [Pristionchus fissidentatus]
QPGNLMDFLTKSFLGGMFKMDQLAPMLLPDCGGLTSPPCPTPLVPPQPALPGSIAIAAMPTAKLFQKDDWSWHRNPAASIRSGGTNKQTPVWKYFVYDKAENLSRCIVGDCTYQLKGPHTSTLACHLKKHPAEYNEFTKLKSDYSRERVVSQMPPSPASSSSGNSTISAATKLNESMLLHHNNNNEQLQQHKEKLQAAATADQQFEQMQQAAIAAAAVHHEPRPRSNCSSTQRVTPPLPVPATAAAHTAMSPFSYLFPNPAGAVNPLLAHTLMQQGMALGPHGQLVLSKKWRRDERKQREMEHRLSLFISSARLPSSIVHDAAFRELLESAQPKFSCPTDTSQIEQVLTAQHGRLQMALRQALHAVRRMSIMVDCIAVGGGSYRVAITASLPTPAGTREQLLLAVRSVESSEDESSTDAVHAVIEQVVAENGITADKITRVITSGMERDGRDNIGRMKRLLSYRPRLLAHFMHIIDSNERIQELKKRFCELIVTLVSHEGLMNALINATGRPLSLPFTESFVALLEAVQPIKGELKAVLLGAGIEVLTRDDWQLASTILAILSCLSPPHSLMHNQDSIDTVIPSLMQIMGILKENEEVSACFGDELREEIETVCGSITNPNESLMEPDFLVATALNPERILLLNEEQTNFAKQQLQRMVQERVARQEEASSRKRPFNSLDQLLATVIDRQCGNSGDNGLASSIYPNFVKKKEHSERNRFTDAIVQAYFDEMTQSDTNTMSSMFSHSKQQPSAFWHSNTHRCPQLSEIALELFSIPASTPGVEGLFGVKAGNFDATSLLILPERLERDTMLRFNRALVPKTI